MSATAGQSRGSRRRSSTKGTSTIVSAGRTPSSSIVVPSAVVVEGEFGRVRPQPDDVGLVLALVLDPGPDQLVAEHAAGRQEVVIVLERGECLFERRRHLCDTTILLEEIPVRRLARVQAF